MNRPDLLSPPKVAERLGVDATTVLRWIKAGHLPAVKTPGRRHFVHVDDVQAIESQMGASS